MPAETALTAANRPSLSTLRGTSPRAPADQASVAAVSSGSTVCESVDAVGLADKVVSRLVGQHGRQAGPGQRIVRYHDHPDIVG